MFDIMLERHKVKLINGDSLEYLKSLDSESVDAVVTDPPYLYLKNQKLERPFNELEFFTEAFRVLKQNSYLLFFGRGVSMARWTMICDDLGFKFKDVITAMYVEAPLKYDNLCFIDTPGYDASEDADVSHGFGEEMKTLIWLVNGEGGTILRSDLGRIEWLLKSKESEKEIFIVLSKADLKPNREIEELLTEIEGVLNEREITYRGISAFNSMESKEILYRKESIFDFLEKKNEVVDIKAKESIRQGFKDILDLYERAIEKEKRFVEDVENAIHSLKMDVVAKCLGERPEFPIEDELRRRKNSYENDERQLEELREEISRALEETFRESRLNIEE